jgi:hypothetical protein
MHSRPVSGTDDKACRGVKLFDDTGKKVFPDERGAVLDPEKPCDCKKFAARPVK